MATPTKKQTHHTPRKRRKKHALSSGGKRRRRTSHRKGGLADMFNPTIAMHSAKSTLLAAGGGLGAMIVNKSILPPTASKATKTVTALVAGFVASAFNMPTLGAGFTGGMMALTYQNGLLADDNTEFADEEVLSDSPMALDEEGNPLILEEGDGEPYWRSLTESEMIAYERGQ